MAPADSSDFGKNPIAIKTIAECSIDILLAGHFHIADVGYTAKRYNIPGYSALIVSSGTSTSTRGRGQPNSLNMICIDRPTISIQRQIWNSETRGFDGLLLERFHRTPDGWIRE